MSIEQPTITIETEKGNKKEKNEAIEAKLASLLGDLIYLNGYMDQAEVSSDVVRYEVGRINRRLWEIASMEDATEQIKNVSEFASSLASAETITRDKTQYLAELVETSFHE